MSFLLLGHYQAAINAAGSFKAPDGQAKLQRDVMLYRAHIEQGDLALTIEEIRYFIKCSTTFCGPFCRAHTFAFSGPF